jgi:hypothetical protein
MNWKSQAPHGALGLSGEEGRKARERGAGHIINYCHHY